MATRGIRNKNPGCLKCKGTAGRDKDGFAIYNTWEEGYYALNSLLYRVYNGKSLRQVFKVYAPASDGNNPRSYAQTVARGLREAGFNVTADTPIDMTNPQIRAAVVCAISEMECGKIPGGRDYAIEQTNAYDPATDPKRGTMLVRGGGKPSKIARTTRGGAANTAPANDGVQISVARDEAAQERRARDEAAQKRRGRPSSSNPSAFADVDRGGRSTEPTLNTNTQSSDEDKLRAQVFAAYKGKKPPKKLNWFQRNFPSFLGGATKQEKLVDRIFYPRGKDGVLDATREMFPGVSVQDLRNAGFSDDKIIQMQANIDAKRQTQGPMGLVNRLASAGVQMNAQELGITRNEILTISALVKNNATRG